MRRGAAVAAAALTAALAACGGGGGGGEPAGGAAGGGAALGRGAVAAVAAGEAERRRWPASCWLEDGAAAAVAGLAEGKPGRLVVGVVADARGEAGAPAASAASAAFDAAKVDLVVSLGGQGTSEAELASVLGALARPGRPLLAMPGDTEAAAAHRAAVAALAARGLPVVDAAAAGVLVARGVILGFVPGRPIGAGGAWHGLVAGAAGCGRTAEEEAAFAARFAAGSEPRLLFAHDPPRQRGAGGTDMATGGVHAGEPGVAKLAEGARVVVHAGLDEAAGRSVRAGALLFAASGALAPGPAELAPSALIIEIGGGRTTARAVPLPR